jgi:hypothetical protein
MATVQASPGQQQAAMQFAADKYHIPLWVLEGVYAIETSSGSNIATSSAGAQGAFQFIPSTARQYNYPLTNNVDNVTFGQQADAAAHYLSDLFHGHGGNWDAALHAYSGGGYGESQVQSKAGGKIAGSDVNPNSPVGAAAGAVGAVGDVATSVGNIATLLTSTEFWLRLGEAIAGIILIYLGLRALTGQEGSAGQQAQHIKRVIIPV